MSQCNNLIAPSSLGLERLSCSISFFLRERELCIILPSILQSKAKEAVIWVCIYVYKTGGGEEEGQGKKEAIMLTGFVLNKVFFRSVHGGRGEGERVKTNL